MTALMICAVVYCSFMASFCHCWFVPSYSDGKRISELNIAGTHDSLSKVGGFGSYARCQEWDLRKQLDNGIRFIDVRARHYQNGLPIHHGPVFQETNFAAAMNTINDYLKANPTEFVLVSVKEEHTPEGNNEGFDTSVKKVLEQHSDHWWRGGDDNPTVSEIRGKFVLIPRFGTSERLGISWNSFDIQDNYDHTAIDDKKNSISSQIDKALKGDKNTKFLNFISVSRVPSSTPQADSSVLNYYLYQKLQEVGGINNKRVGIIAMDFPKNDIIQMLNGGVAGGDAGKGDINSIKPNEEEEKCKGLGCGQD